MVVHVLTHSPLLQKGALENTVAETEARYGAMLQGYQDQIHMQEAELGEEDPITLITGSHHLPYI